MDHVETSRAAFKSSDIGIGRLIAHAQQDDVKKNLSKIRRRS
jgi:hypothetical protein